MTTDPDQAASEHRADTPGQAVLFGTFRLEPARQRLLEGNAQVQLGSRAFELLVALTGQPGEVVSNRDLVARVWPGVFVEDSNLRVHVAGLRKALRDGQNGQRYVVNVPGRGYSFVAPVQVVSAEDAGPAARPAAAPRSSLPRATTRLIGREALVETVCLQLGQRRFVTLVGPGGIGKTSVALAVAHQLSGSYPDGAYFIDFTTIRDVGLVASTIAATLGLGVPSQDAMPAVIADIGRKRLLLVLDNCEHVVEPAADAAETIFAAAPGVHLLSTSREPLRAAGERVHRLPPLEMPPRSPGLTAAEALSFACVQLFVERVSASLGGYSLNDADAPAVAAICHKLDGIPLAIEFAAARVAAFGMQELAGRLDDRFRLLTSGRRTALPRHQTLSATLDWSYELLPPAEQALLRRLSVFAGDFSLEGAAAVTIEPEAKPGVVSQVADLVSKSLVVAEWGRDGARYHLLETTRLYGAEKLRAEGELPGACRAHATHMLGVFRPAEHDAQVMPTPQWRATYASQIDNLRKALDWASAPDGDPALYVALCIAAVPLWVHLSLMAECRARIERALDLVAGEDRAAQETRLRLTAARGWSLMYAAGRGSEIADTWAAALALAEALDDTSYRLRALWGIWMGKLNRGELDTALAIANRLLDLVRGSSNDGDVMMADRLMATTLHYRGDQDGARRFIERMLDRYDAAIEHPMLARFHVDQRVPAGYFRARIVWLQGYPDLALQAVAQNITEGIALGHALSFGSVLGQAACPIALLTGDLAAARRYGDMLLDHAERHALHLWRDWAVCFLGLVTVKEGGVEAGLAAMRAIFDKAGDNRFLPRYMVLLAEYASADGHANQRGPGIATLDEMLARCARTGERWYEAELTRLRAELLHPDQAQSAEAALSGAMELAKRQGARTLQLRTATSMARLRQRSGDAAGARAVLEPVFAAFTEGFATADLLQAAAVLSGRP